MIVPRINTTCLAQICVFVYILINYCVIEVSCQEDVMIKMKALKDRLFKDYDRDIRPMNNTNITRVDMFMIPAQMMSLDEETAMLSFDSYLNMHWVDHRLAWDKSEFDGYLVLQPDSIWLPDVTVINSHARQIDPFKEVLLSVDWTGDVFWTPPLHSQTYCPSLAQAIYPSDKVDCIIELASWAHDGFILDFFHHGEIYFDFYNDVNPRWTLIQSETKAVINETLYKGPDDDWSYRIVKIDIHLPLQRRPVPEIEASRVSCTLVIVLTLSIFWLPPDSSKKVLLGGVLFLVLNLLLVFVAFSTKYPLAVLYAVSYVQSAMYLLVATLLLQVIFVTRMASMRGPSRPPPAITLVLTGAVGKWACLTGPGGPDDSPDKIQLNQEFASSQGGLSAGEEWRLVASALDRLLFVVMALVSISIHHL